MTSIDTFDVLTLTEEARNVVIDALNNETPSETLALWVEVTGTRGAGYSYDLYFSELNLAPEDAAIGRDGDVTIVVPAASVDRLRGSRLEFANEGGGGLVLVNPNSPTPEEINPGLHRRSSSSASLDPSDRLRWWCSKSRSIPPSPPTAAAPTWWR